MILYTCVHGNAFGGLPAPLAHPCGRAAEALADSGHTDDLEEVKGGSLKFWTWPARAQDLAEVEKLSGQRAVPVLVLDDGEAVAGSEAIAQWRKRIRERAS